MSKLPNKHPNKLIGTQVTGHNGNDGNRGLELLSYLTGTWSVQIRTLVHGTLLDAPLGFTQSWALAARAQFISQTDGTVLGTYSAAASETAEELWQVLLSSDPSTESVLASLPHEPSRTCIEVAWTDSYLYFISEFHESDTLWSIIPTMLPTISGCPSVVTVIPRQFSDSAWLPDVGYSIPEITLSGVRQKPMLCRVQLSHRRMIGRNSLSPVVANLMTTIDQALCRIEDIRQDVEFEIGEIEELIDSLEDAKAILDDQVQLLNELVENAKEVKDDAESADDDLQDAILQLHYNLTCSEKANQTHVQSADPIGEAYAFTDRSGD